MDTFGVGIHTYIHWVQGYMDTFGVGIHTYIHWVQGYMDTRGVGIHGYIGCRETWIHGYTVGRDFDIIF